MVKLENTLRKLAGPVQIKFKKDKANLKNDSYEKSSLAHHILLLGVI